MQEVVFSIALRNSQSKELKELALENIRKQLPELIRNYVDSKDGKKQTEEGLHDSSPEVLHLILSYYFQESSFLQLPAETKETFLKNLRRDFPIDVVPVVLAPLLYPGDGETSSKTVNTNMTANQVVIKVI